MWARNVIEQQMIELEWLEMRVEHRQMLGYCAKHYVEVILPDITSSREQLSSLSILAGLAHDCDHIHTALQNAWTAQL